MLIHACVYTYTYCIYTHTPLVHLVIHVTEGNILTWDSIVRADQRFRISATSCLNPVNSEKEIVIMCYHQEASMTHITLNHLLIKHCMKNAGALTTTTFSTCVNSNTEIYKQNKTKSHT